MVILGQEITRYVKEGFITMHNSYLKIMIELLNPTTRLLLCFSMMFFLSCSSGTDNDPAAQQPLTGTTSRLRIDSQSDFENINWELIDTITDYLEISSTEIEDLTFLGDICLQGIFQLTGNESLTSLKGLENLTCTSSFRIWSNFNLTDYSALGQLENIDDLELRGNSTRMIEPIVGLTRVNGKVDISEAALFDYRMLRNLESVNSIRLLGNRSIHLMIWRIYQR